MAADARHIVAVGMFDGLHRGHAFVLQQLKRLGAERGLEPEVLTFADHPAATLAPDHAPRLIMPGSRKAGLIASRFGIKAVKLIDFSPEFAAMTGAEFLALLKHEYSAACIAMGFNNHIGSDRLDAAAAAECGIIDVVALPQFPEASGLCSSAAREAVGKADFGEAGRILGYAFELCGTVVHGNKLGRTIGYPTANISPQAGPRQLLPPDGVYAAEAFTGESNTPFRAVVNIGLRPTVDSTGRGRTIEAHLLDFDSDIYGSLLRLEFLSRIRGEKKFESLADLRCQIDKDADSARFL